MDELTILLGFIISLVLTLVIANAGTKRKIGFGWAFFLGIWFTPIVSFIAVILSEKLGQDEEGKSIKKWGCLAPVIVSIMIIGLLILTIYSINASQTYRVYTPIELPSLELNETQSKQVKPKKYSNSKEAIKSNNELVIPELVFDDIKETVDTLIIKKNTNPDNEIEVDLNDYFDSPNDITDWNYTELSQEGIAYLISKGVYFSKNRNAWVKSRISEGIVNNKDKKDSTQNHQSNTSETIGTGVSAQHSYVLAGRYMLDKIPSVTNPYNEEGVIIINIEVAPNGSIIDYEIDKQSTIDNAEIKRLCVTSVIKIKFNSINSNRNQFGKIIMVFRNPT